MQAAQVSIHRAPFLFMILFFESTWDLSSLTRHRTRISCLGGRVSTRWTAREVRNLHKLLIGHPGSGFQRSVLVRFAFNRSDSSDELEVGFHGRKTKEADRRERSCKSSRERWQSTELRHGSGNRKEGINYKRI